MTLETRKKDIAMATGASKIKIILDQRFLFSLRPENIARLGIVLFFITLIIAPVQLIGNISIKAFSYIFLCLIGFVIGCQVVRVTKNNIPDYISFYISKNKLDKTYKVFLVLSIIGVVCKFIDVFLIRGVSWSVSTVENQDALSEGGGNLFSIVSAILIFITYLPITIDYIARDYHTKREKNFSILIFATNLLDCLSTGSRFALIRPIFYFAILLLLSGTLKKYSTKKILTIVVMSILVLGNIIGAMFLRRLQDMNLDAAMSLAAEYGGYAKNVPVSEGYLELMNNSKEEWYYPYLYTYVNVTQYITHAVFEFPDVMDFVDKNDKFFYGESTFFVYTKFINKLTGSKEDISKNISKYNLRPGIWSTFFFSWYLDFGWFGIFLFSLLGVLAKKMWANAFIRHNIYYIPITIFFTLIWLLLLQLNYIQGSGTYAITIFIIVGLLCNQGKIYNLKKQPPI